MKNELEIGLYAAVKAGAYQQAAAHLAAIRDEPVRRATERAVTIYLTVGWNY